MSLSIPPIKTLILAALNSEKIDYKSKKSEKFINENTKYKK